MIVQADSVLTLQDDGWIKEVEHVRSPDHGGDITPVYLIMHYTGSGSGKGSIDWLSKKDEIYVSAHIVVDRDGFTTQLIPFTKKAYHAGVSEYAGVSGLNSCSIGIELVNYGKLTRSSVELLRSPTGKDIPLSDGVFRKHKNEQLMYWWQRFTEQQVIAAVVLGRLLFRKYKMKSVLGHDDIAPTRKVDPGPAFPMDEVRALITTGG